MELARKVAEAKAQELTCCELSTKYCLGSTACLMTLGFGCLTVVPTNTKMAVFRFGKLDGMIETPGCHCVVPCFDPVKQFAGTQTHKIEQLHVIDATGNPIVVRALLEYAIHDPAALYIATSSSLMVLINMAEQVVRVACSKLPLLGEPGHDIRSQTTELGEAMVAELQPDASVFGVTVQRLVIVEAGYSPEIAPQMLMKQQAGALVAAREQIVAGALNIVRDALREFPGMSPEGRERLTSNLLVTLTSHSQAVPTISMS